MLDYGSLGSPASKMMRTVRSSGFGNSTIQVSSAVPPRLVVWSQPSQRSMVKPTAGAAIRLRFSDVFDTNVVHSPEATLLVMMQLMSAPTPMPFPVTVPDPSPSTVIRMPQPGSNSNSNIIMAVICSVLPWKNPVMALNTPTQAVPMTL